MRQTMRGFGCEGTLTAGLPPTSLRSCKRGKGHQQGQGWGHGRPQNVPSGHSLEAAAWGSKGLEPGRSSSPRAGAVRGHGCPQRELRCPWGLGGAGTARGGHRAGQRGIHTPSDSSPISKQKQRCREEPHAERSQERRDKKREEKGRRGQRLVLTHLSVCLSVRGCPGARGQSHTSFPAHHQSLGATRSQSSTRRVTKQERQRRCLPSG